MYRPQLVETGARAPVPIHIPGRTFLLTTHTTLPAVAPSPGFQDPRLPTHANATVLHTLPPFPLHTTF